MTQLDLIVIGAGSAGISAANAAGESPPLREDLRVVPRVTFAEPEIASVGLTEPEARESGHEVTVRRHDFATQSRALMMGELKGFVKIVVDARSEESWEDTSSVLEPGN